MKSKHTILKEKYMVNQPIYTDVDKIKYSKNKLFMEKIFRDYGFPYSMMHDESISLACILIELLSMYRDNAMTSIEKIPCYIPDTDWWFKTKQKNWFSIVYNTDASITLHSLDKPNTIQTTFAMKCRTASLKRVIHLIIKGCRIYLSNSYVIGKPTKIDECIYKQYCKSINQPYRHLSEVGVDGEFNGYCEDWFTYALICLAFNASQIWY